MGSKDPLSVSGIRVAKVLSSLRNLIKSKYSKLNGNFDLILCVIRLLKLNLQCTAHPHFINFYFLINVSVLVSLPDIICTA